MDDTPLPSSIILNSIFVIWVACITKLQSCAGDLFVLEGSSGGKAIPYTCQPALESFGAIGSLCIDWGPFMRSLM